MMWLMALGMALFLEGLFLGLRPQIWRRTVAELQKMSDAQLSRLGLGVCAVALLLLLLAHWGSAS